MSRGKISVGKKGGTVRCATVSYHTSSTPPPCHAPSPPHCKQTLAMTGGKVDFALIREATRLELVKLLDSVHGTKVRMYPST